MTPTTESNTYRAETATARDERILAYLPLVKRIAHGFAVHLPREVEQADLVGTGTVGLIRAVDRFDPSRGLRFETYAARCIRQAILDFLRGQDPLPYSTRIKIRRLEASMTRLQRKLGRAPTEEEIAGDLRITNLEVSDLLAQSSSLPLYALDDGSDRAVEADGREGEATTVVDQIEQEQVKESLGGLIRDLPGNERLVLMLYYYEGLKMKEIADLLRLTESRISQIHGKALTFLRANLRKILEL